MTFCVVIPARFASTRLPGKPLADLHGLPMIARVAMAAAGSGAAEVLVAADDQRVRDAVPSLPRVRVTMTRPDHLCGSDRALEAAQRAGWPDDRIIVNLQGDEPLLPPALLDQVAAALAQCPGAGAATLAEPLQRPADVFDENVVKVAVSASGRALYFSRAPIPWARGRFGAGRTDALETDARSWRRHIGLYAYRLRTLRRFASWAPGRLEALESLEQLRFLERDVDIAVRDAAAPAPGGVDTPADLERVRAALRAKGAPAGAQRHPSRAGKAP